MYPRVIFIISAFKDSTHLFRQIDRLQHRQHLFFIHVDDSRESEDMQFILDIVYHMKSSFFWGETRAHYTQKYTQEVLEKKRIFLSRQFSSLFASMQDKR